MKFSVKNILFSTLFLIGTLWCYHAIFQQDGFMTLSELRKDSNSSSNYIDADTEIQDVEQIVYTLEFASLIAQNTMLSPLHISNRLSEPHFPIWQPPKLS